MKFSVAALPLVALFAQQAVAIAIPYSADVSAELEARHHTPGQRAGNFGGFKNGGGNKNGGGTKTGSGTGGKGAAAGAGAVAGAGAAAAAGGGKGGNGGTTTASSAVIGTSTSSASTASSTAAGTTANITPGSKGSNAGLTAQQVTALQTSTTLDPTQIQPGLALDGQAVPEAGQVASLTSTNNFMNFCATQSGVPLTNGQQVKTGSCNPTIMGSILATNKLPSSKFQFPVNMQTIARNTTFTIKMAISNMVTGNFVNAASNYFAAPQQVDKTGTLVGHSHVVIEPMTSLTQTTPTVPTTFSFFKGLNAAAVGGVLTADVTGGLNPGVYRLSSINTAANHQPALGSVAQHGSFDDQVYFTVQ